MDNYMCGCYYLEDCYMANKAIHHFEISLIHPEYKAQSAYQLGMCYKRLQNDEKTYHYFKLGAADGHYNSISELAMYYKNTAQHYGKAIKYYQLCLQHKDNFNQVSQTDYNACVVKFIEKISEMLLVKDYVSAYKLSCYHTTSLHGNIYRMLYIRYTQILKVHIHNVCADIVFNYLIVK